MGQGAVVIGAHMVLGSRQGVVATHGDSFPSRVRGRVLWND